jgi:predicted alpha-1,2-mannosidase
MFTPSLMLPLLRPLKATPTHRLLPAKASVPAKIKSIVAFTFCLLTPLFVWAKDPSLVALASPLMGTDSSVQFSHGNEYPSIALPFPMNAWAPYTQPQRDSFFYQFRRKQIRGLRQTHQPSPWMGDYGNFALMPVSGQLVVTEQERASEFQHENEFAEPAYYSVQLDTWNARAEVTPTERAARFRFTFNAPGDSYVILDVFEDRVRHGEVKLIPSENKIIGIARDNRGGVPPNFANYFVIVFDRPFSSFGVWSTDSVQPGVTHLEHKHAGAFAKFDTSKEHVVGCKVASSYISPGQAELNLQREIGNADFDEVRQQAEARWNEQLGRALVSGGTDEQRRTFYSCLYRALLFPEKFYELDSAGKPVHYSPYDGKIHEGVLFTDSGFWDTFRAAHPLYTLLFPEVSEQIQQSLLNAYDESGWLPEWPSPGHRSIMIGQNSFSLLADAWVKGVTNFDASKAVEAMVHDANSDGPMPAVGRDGVQHYNKLGYVPYSSTKGEPRVEEATAKTLEYAYDDFCAARLAQAVGKNLEAETFARHAFNYTNLFDPHVAFMRERKADGSWNEPFYPDQWGGGFTEGCSWHWTWCVFQDIPGLVRLMGGDKAFADKLNAVFDTEPTVRVGTYGGMIHEMTEMVAANMGQYAHGNEPIHHMLYLYDYVGQPWKTQSRVRQVLNLLYQPTPAGYCGDEDTGQMSAWYVLSALGFYPVCPGTPEYIIGSPLFDRATLTFPGPKTFTIIAEDNSMQKPYIRHAELNDVSFDRTFIEHDELVRGGELVFHMTSAPDYHWATGPESRPPSAMQNLTRAKSDQAAHP